MFDLKKRIYIISFFTTFFIRLGIFLIAGIILCLIGTKYWQCLAVGVALIAFDFLASIIETVKLHLTLLRGGHPAVEDIRDALNSVNSEEEMQKMMDQIENNPDSLHARTGRYFLQGKLNDDSTAEDIVAAYEELCKDEELPNLTYDCNCENDEFVFCMTRDYENSEGEYFQLRTTIRYDRPPKRFYECLLLNGDKQKFLDGVRSSKGYKYASENKGRDLKIYILET